MGRPVHWTRNWRYVFLELLATFKTNTQYFLDYYISLVIDRCFLIITVANYNFDKSKQCIGAVTIEIDFLQKKSTDSSPYDSDKMAAEFIQYFNNQSFSVGQQVSVIPQNIPSEIQVYVMLYCKCSSLLYLP